MRERGWSPAAAAGAVVLAAWGCAGQRPVGEPSPAAGAVRAARVEMEPYVAGLRTIPMSIDSWSGPLLFDTGGGLLVVTPRVAEAIGCVPFGRVTGFRHSGEAIHAERCGNRQIALGTWRGEREPAVWDLMSLLEGLPEVGGLVGLVAFEGQVLTIDYARGRLGVASPGQMELPPPAARPLTVRSSRQAGGASLDLFVAVDAPGGPLWLELDSGNAGPVLLAPHALAQLGIALPAGETQPVTLELTGYGPIRLEAARKEDIIYDGLLNLDFFLRHVVTLDLAAMRAWARPLDRPEGD